jgi:hypothetical protein
MKKIALFLLCLLLTTTGFTANLVLDNQTSYPNKDQKSKIAIQWATSAKEMDDANNALMQGSKLDPKSFQMINQSGKTTLTIPPNAEYFRILAWSTADTDPDFVTNWVDVVPKKTYTVKADHLVPSVLMLGTGC